MARATTSRSALMRVGRNPVVPKRRWARPMARIVSTVGASLKSTPPPPLTCESMKPGSSSWPPRSYLSARRARRSEEIGEHTSELQSPDTISYAVFCLKKKKQRFQVDANVAVSHVGYHDTFSQEPPYHHHQ